MNGLIRIESEEVGFPQVPMGPAQSQATSLLIPHASQIFGLLSSSLHSEEVGFEPTKHFRVYTLSKRAPSATRTLLQKRESRVPQF